MKNLFIIILFATLLSGCASNVKLSGRFLSNVDEDINIDKSSSILLVSDSSGDKLTNKRYVSDIITAFKARGFTSISTHEITPDYTLVFNFTYSKETELKSIPIFKRERSRAYRVCHRNKDGKTRTCRIQRHFSAPMIAGYQSITTPINLYTFEFTLENKQDNTVLHSISTAMHESCSQWKVYDFLVSDAISKTSFSQPIDTEYSVTMPKDYNCQ
ncbi:MAG: hypothetical protein ACTIM4_05440 [Marinomonas sp.]